MNRERPSDTAPRREGSPDAIRHLAAERLARVPRRLNRPLTRLLLIGALVLGLGAMHTLGHAEHGEHGRPTALAGTAAQAVSHQSAHPGTAQAVSHQSARLASTALTAFGAPFAATPETPQPLDPLAICLAVLLALAVLARTRAMLRRALRRSPPGHRPTGAGRRTGGRAPPGLGLRPTSSVVLRI